MLEEGCEEAAEDSEDALTKITELMTTMGLLAEFTAKFTAKALQGTATRAQVAVILMAYDKNLAV